MAGAVRMVVPAVELEPTAPSPQRPAVPPPRSAPPPQTGPSEVDFRGLRADEAESATQAALDAAILADRPLVRIIHGMGTGAVREAVRRVLAADRRVNKFGFAPRNQGGTGVTIVELGA
jgi:DNA mismatch repair protein MutS2